MAKEKFNKKKFEERYLENKQKCRKFYYQVKEKNKLLEFFYSILKFKEDDKYTESLYKQNKAILKLRKRKNKKWNKHK